MASISNYTYVQNELLFKVYGATMLRIRTKLGLTQKDFSELLQVSTVVYNKLEMPVVRGTSEYMKPSEQFYNNFCVWFKSLTRRMQMFLTESVSHFQVVEFIDPNSTKATENRATVTVSKIVPADKIFEFSIKSLTAMDRDKLKEIEDFLLSKGIIAYVH